MQIIFDLDGTIFQTRFCEINAVMESLLSKGHSLYICSNGSMEYIELVLQRTKIINYFCEIYSAKNYSSKAEAVKKIIDCNQSAILIGDTSSDLNPIIISGNQ